MSKHIQADLRKEWKGIMEKYKDLSGEWLLKSEELGEHRVMLPGTLDTNGIGREDEKELAGRLTRLHTFEGAVRFVKKVMLPKAEGGRLFLEAERARQLSLLVNGTEVEAFVPGTLSTPYVYEVTAFAGQEAELTFISDNRYEAWSRESIIGASAVTDETQTNWNGILGYLGIRREEQTFIQSLRIYPQAGCRSVRIEADICGLAREEKIKGQNGEISLKLQSEAFKEGCVEIPVSVEGAKRRNMLPEQKRVQDQKTAQETVSQENIWEAEQEGYNIRNVKSEKNCTTIVLTKVLLKEDIRRWDEEEGNLYQVCASLSTSEEENRSNYTTCFGVREFGQNEAHRLTINQRVFFLRGEANCCVFPEEGHPPVDKESWKRVLSTYASYGVNCMRFHSWCPPEAAFAAADEMGMMMEPELSHWNCKDAFEDTKAQEYYRLELTGILRTLANHPSFVMLTFGNELWATKRGHEVMDELLKIAHSTDATRLYANSSNANYGEFGLDEASDFYTSAGFYEEMLRATSSPMVGHLNEAYPTATHNYQKTVEKILQEGKPVFGFEVGQYEVLPEFSEIAAFQGVTRARNLEIIKEHVEAAGQLSDWDKAVEATGELSLLGYREEVEAVLRTPGMSGLSLLGLQDFPGQGTALVGMLNSHLQPKPYSFAKPERFRNFYRPVLPLLYLEKYTYEEGETIEAQVKLANYGKKPIYARAGWVLRTEGGRVLEEGHFAEAVYENQGLQDVGEAVIFCGKLSAGERLFVDIYVGEHTNSYPIWIYPKKKPIKPWNGEYCKILTSLTGEEIEKIKAGDVVYLEPKPVKENFPASIGGQFSTDFWSVGTFPAQEGGMGMMIDRTHPALQDFPTKEHSDWQWWPMAGGRPMILPGGMKAIVRVPDSYSRLKNMGLLVEMQIGKGVVMLSSMGLLYKQQYPECRALLHSILTYLKEEIPGKIEAGALQKADEEALAGLVKVQYGTAKKRFA